MPGRPPEAAAKAAPGEPSDASPARRARPVLARLPCAVPEQQCPGARTPPLRADGQQAHGHIRVLPGWQGEHVTAGRLPGLIEREPELPRISEARQPGRELCCGLDRQLRIVEPLALRHYLVAAVQSAGVSTGIDELELHACSQHPGPPDGNAISARGSAAARHSVTVTGHQTRQIARQCHRNRHSVRSIRRILSVTTRVSASIAGVAPRDSRMPGLVKNSSCACRQARRRRRSPGPRRARTASSTSLIGPISDLGELNDRRRQAS